MKKGLTEGVGGDLSLVKCTPPFYKLRVYILCIILFTCRVANHMGYQATSDSSDFSTFVPFDKPEHYNDYCNIEDSDWNQNQHRVNNNIINETTKLMLYLI